MIARADSPKVDASRWTVYYHTYNDTVAFIKEYWKRKSSVELVSMLACPTGIRLRNKWQTEILVDPAMSASLMMMVLRDQHEDILPFIHGSLEAPECVLLRDWKILAEAVYPPALHKFDVATARQLLERSAAATVFDSHSLHALEVAHATVKEWYMAEVKKIPFPHSMRESPVGRAIQGTCEAFSDVVDLVRDALKATTVDQPIPVDHGIPPGDDILPRVPVSLKIDITSLSKPSGFTEDLEALSIAELKKLTNDVLEVEWRQTRVAMEIALCPTNNKAIGDLYEKAKARLHAIDQRMNESKLMLYKKMGDHKVAMRKERNRIRDDYRQLRKAAHRRPANVNVEIDKMRKAFQEAWKAYIISLMEGRPAYSQLRIEVLYGRRDFIDEVVIDNFLSQSANPHAMIRVADAKRECLRAGLRILEIMKEKHEKYANVYAVLIEDIDAILSVRSAEAKDYRDHPVPIIRTLRSNITAELIGLRHAKRTLKSAILFHQHEQQLLDAQHTVNTLLYKAFKFHCEGKTDAGMETERAAHEQLQALNSRTLKPCQNPFESSDKRVPPYHLPYDDTDKLVTLFKSLSLD